MVLTAVAALAGCGLGGAALAITQKNKQAVDKRVAALELGEAKRTSAAFVFIKPHAVTDEVKALVTKQLKEAGITVVSQGTIPAERIDKAQLIDIHYGAIAAKAVKQKPNTLTVQPKAKAEFQSTFGLSWEDALSKGLVFNATDGAAKLGVDYDGLGAKWGQLKKGVDMLKFGGGFYCGKVDDIFVINGFYMDMRKAFTRPGTCIYYYETQWPASTLAWADFRGKVLGGTDPKSADAGSLRNMIHQAWQTLNLQGEPNTGDNGVHASASPFEALAERANWLGATIDKDMYGSAMVTSGVPLATIKAWTDDPPVNFEGKKQSLFDLLEDMCPEECLKKSVEISMQQ
jgi:nucleoside diphosphate kinase